MFLVGVTPSVVIILIALFKTVTTIKFFLFSEYDIALPNKLEKALNSISFYIILRNEAKLYFYLYSSRILLTKTKDSIYSSKEDVYIEFIYSELIVLVTLINSDTKALLLIRR